MSAVSKKRALRLSIYDRLKDRAFYGSVATAGIKAGGAVLGLLVFTIAARTLGPREFGKLAIWYNGLSFMAVVAVFGQETLIVRSWGEFLGQGQFGLTLGAYRFGWAITAGSALLWGGAAAIVVLALGGSYERVFAAALFLALQTLLHFSSHSSRNIAGYIVSETNRELTWRIVLLVCVVFGLRELSLTRFFMSAAFGLALSVIIQSVMVRKRFPDQVKRASATIDGRAWLMRALAMWFSAVIEAASQYAEVVLLGWIVSPATAGQYFVAARIANVFLMLGTGLHTYSISNAASLYYSGDRARLRAILRSVMTVAAALMTPILLAILAFSSKLLLIFGPGYAEASQTVLVLSVAAFTIAMTGPSPGLLLITGHEKLYSRAVAATLVLRLILVFVLAPRFGAPGAALAWGLANVPLAVGLSIFCRAKSGIDPSIFGAFNAAPKLTAASRQS